MDGSSILFIPNMGRIMSRATRYLTLEWLFWCVLIGIFWMQTDAFSENIAEYQFGASGWPKMVLIGLLIGATGQFGLGLLGLKSSGGEANASREPARQISRPQQIAIFVLPLLYLWFMHRIGFFVATPIFILVYLRVLEVKRLTHLLAVTAFIYVFVLALFVRFFYVALPVGAWPTFYDINNQIITIVRLGI